MSYLHARILKLTADEGSQAEGTIGIPWCRYAGVYYELPTGKTGNLKLETLGRAVFNSAVSHGDEVQDKAPDEEDVVGEDIVITFSEAEPGTTIDVRTLLHYGP